MTDLTPRGVAFLVSGVAGLAAGIAWGSLAATAAGLSLLASLALALLRRPAADARPLRRLSADVVHEGARIEVAIDAPRRRGTRVVDTVPPGFRVHGAPDLANFGLEAVAAGRWTLGPIRIVHEDPLGLTRHVEVVEERHRVTIYPAAEPVRSVPLASRISLPLGGPHATGQAGPGSDFYALRGYQQGDTMRDVNWRASARTGKDLVVNQREKESQSLVTYFVDVRAESGVGTRRLNARILAARALATLAGHNAKRRDRPRVVLYGEHVTTPILARAGDTTLTSILDPMLDAGSSGSATLSDAVDATLPALRPRAPVVIVSSFLRDERAPSAVAALRALEQSVTIIAILPEPLLRAALTPEPAMRELLAQHARTLDALRAQGALVVAWDPQRPLALALTEASMK